MGRDCIPLNPAEQPENFNPRAPCGARQFDEEIAATGIPFQSTRPVRGATLTRKNRWCTWTISIHAPRAGCDAGRRGHLTSRASISIHAPRAGCDLARQRVVAGAVRISIHAPRVGRDYVYVTQEIQRDDFNPRAPCGARRLQRWGRPLWWDFNPRAPCGARLACAGRKYRRGGNFNPRAPCGARQPRWNIDAYIHGISIHAPRVGRDHPELLGEHRPTISIHAPRVGRDYTASWMGLAANKISIHAPRVGRDVFIRASRTSAAISIHAPRVGRDENLIVTIDEPFISIHAPRVGRDRLGPRGLAAGTSISIHAPRVGRDQGFYFL